ncbi:MAG: NAD(P)H-hydrate dehydratase [Dehalococcoidia bacterium]|jgi:NAD(P)H-hydrate epimerase|nr:NAD(P)H-hydrate dehydratase [Dehalococcoidia bacterium]MDP7509766.1 NAD(P)H-hydrate dehydratase [Dehalococcoidia bacterium]HJN86955.1 NAD(P)H-hydrate dehydratase [Dehalococcoidia bacterium]
MKIVTAAQMAALEAASERHGVGTDALMENAGLVVARAARHDLGGAAGARVLVLVGPGNNGADGLVAARHLRRWGAEVTAYLVTRRPDTDPKMDLALEYGVGVLRSASDPGLAQLERLLAGSRLVIDAVLGTGRARPLEGAVRDVMLCLGACRGRGRFSTPRPQPRVLALDLPTGLDPDTGEVDPACPVADLTVALGLPKAGLLAFPGAAHAGELKVADIGLPSGLEEEERIDLELLTSELAGWLLPARPLNSHKGTFGHALVIAGSRNYVGAAYLASQAAVRSGAGLVTLATPRSVYPIAAAKLTEVIHLPLPDDDAGRVSPEAVDSIRSNLERYSSILLGCGLGWSAGTTDFVERLLPEVRPSVPLLIDADGLNNLSGLAGWRRRLRGPVAVTPHPGEMATLTGASTLEVQQDRVESARRWAAHWNATVVLKGAHTVIAEPGGLVRVSPFANPGLASGGTGDVLAGIIAGLLARGLSPADAACCGVYLHGRVAEAVRDRMGDAGTIASDLIERLPETMARLRRDASAEG